jgi:hypothetical protein
VVKNDQAEPSGEIVEEESSEGVSYWSPDGAGPSLLRAMVRDHFLTVAQMYRHRGRTKEATQFEEFARELSKVVQAGES